MLAELFNHAFNAQVSNTIYTVRLLRGVLFRFWLRTPQVAIMLTVLWIQSCNCVGFNACILPLLCVCVCFEVQWVFCSLYIFLGHVHGGLRCHQS